MAASSHKTNRFVSPFMGASARALLGRRGRLRGRDTRWRAGRQTRAQRLWHVFLPPDFPQVAVVDWRSPAGERGRGLLCELPAAVRTGPARVWTPAIETLLTVAPWSGRRRGRLRRALPYLLEDQLLMEPESLVFVHHETATGIFVAVTAKDRLAAWRAALDQAGVRASLCPVTLALPRRDHAWSCRFADGQWAVRTGPYSGFGTAGHERHPPAAFEQALAAAREQGVVPEAIILFDGDENLRAMLATQLSLVVIADGRHAGDGETPVFRLGETGNLVGAAGRATLPALRPALIAIALWFVLGFAHTVFEWVRLAHRESRMRVEMASLFTTSFPDTPVLDPAAQMRRGAARVAAQAGGGDGGFLSIMTQASSALSGLAQGSLARLYYHSSRVRCAIRVADLAALARLKAGLGRAGLLVSVAHVVRRPGGVRAQVVIMRRSV
ncbi:MAG TPA: type II secretion system protein GspL [Acidiferrobacter sp.]|nr:type II secretion system protein GspL [Acidiferrobacter sp.]